MAVSSVSSLDPVLKNTWQGLMTFPWENRDCRPPLPPQHLAPRRQRLIQDYASFPEQMNPLDFKQVGWGLDAGILHSFALIWFTLQ